MDLMAPNWIAWLLPALAMSLGWGIRGQFGHESGAMVPGAMVGAALALTLGVGDPRAALALMAMGALGCAVGGVETYGQTVGLACGPPGSASRRWGLLGLAVKGGAWIGLTGGFLGLVLSPVGYQPMELALLMLALTAVGEYGTQRLNDPHDPPRALPRIYFSRRDDAKPRRERWGGLWAGLLALAGYAALRGDGVTPRLMLGGTIGGAAGFALGGWLQAWARSRGKAGDWWKVMECTFGALAGLGLAVAAPAAGAALPPGPTLCPATELAILVIWLAWILAAEYPIPRWNVLWERIFLALILPVTAVAGGRLAAPVIVGPLLIWLSGDNLVRQAVADRLIDARGGWRLLTAATILAAPLCARLAGPAEWFWWLVWSQTLLTVLWMFVRADVWQARGWRAKRTAMGSAPRVELAFVAAAVALTWMAAAVR